MPQVDNNKLREFLKTAPPPSADCCSATVAFNNAYCSCSKEVLDLVKSFTNNNIDQYREGESQTTATLASTGRVSCCEPGASKECVLPYTCHLAVTLRLDRFHCAVRHCAAEWAPRRAAEQHTAPRTASCLPERLDSLPGYTHGGVCTAPRSQCR